MTPPARTGSAQAGGAPPSAAFAMRPELLPELFPSDLLDRLSRVASLRPRVIDVFDGPLDAEILITGWGCPRIDAAVLDGAPRLRAVVHAAGSVKGHLAREVFDRGIAVSSAAEANALPVAEYTIAMLVLAAKRVIPRAREYAAHGWSGDALPGVATPGDSGGLTGAVVGVVGASRVGRLVMDRLRGYGARILLSDPYVTPAEAERAGARLVPLDELCRQAELVTVHAPELPQTRGMFDDRRLSLLRDGAVVINTARGSLIDTDALVRHCATGRIQAVLDVTDPEPLPPGHPLLSMPGVLVTPHISGARGRELRRLGEFAVAEVERYVSGRPFKGAVHAADLDRIA
ncbi:hydroxyacid dehydrogenase [Thermostaphylospora chromogena]|uniref:Phosphoglycerate dehydrogenase n=1 Tax=Thermostaphylospora chromogena TaxID=35622 RepID=A0A1H1HH92_9ACTN|nr:hydroxyacid dehydrogenase [Thermostaphylospora chromogena]SDR24456.1 Phosphoglycerate dehydrogenase [Thermostaphylospora chromogena]